MFSLFRVPQVRYSLLDEIKSPSNLYSSRTFNCRTFPYLLALLLFIIASFFAGRYSPNYGATRNIQSKSDFYLDTEKSVPHGVIVNSVVQIFRYNRTFGEFPSNQTNQAWSELFPEQGGFFKHPTLAPTRSALSVFHQLHCLVCYG